MELRSWLVEATIQHSFVP